MIEPSTEHGPQSQVETTAESRSRKAVRPSTVTHEGSTPAYPIMNGNGRRVQGAVRRSRSGSKLPPEAIRTVKSLMHHG